MDPHWAKSEKTTKKKHFDGRQTLIIMKILMRTTASREERGNQGIHVGVHEAAGEIRAHASLSAWLGQGGSLKKKHMLR